MASYKKNLNTVLIKNRYKTESLKNKLSCLKNKRFKVSGKLCAVEPSNSDVVIFQPAAEFDPGGHHVFAMSAPRSIKHHHPLTILRIFHKSV